MAIVESIEMHLVRCFSIDHRISFSLSLLTPAPQ